MPSVRHRSLFGVSKIRSLLFLGHGSRSPDRIHNTDGQPLAYICSRESEAERNRRDDGRGVPPTQAPASSGAMAAILLPSISKSPRTRSPTFGSMPMMVPPFSRMRCVGSTAGWFSNRRRSSASAGSERARTAAGNPAGAQVIDAQDTIIVPGFVDCHRHSWEAQLRCINRNSPTELTKRKGC
jgi:hypothetical protein